MAYTSVSDFKALINHQIKLQEKIEECLCKVETYMHIATLSEGFYDFNKNTLYNYFWGVADVLNGAIKANQDSLQELYQQTKEAFNQTVTKHL